MYALPKLRKFNDEVISISQAPFTESPTPSTNEINTNICGIILLFVVNTTNNWFSQVHALDLDLNSSVVKSEVFINRVLV